VRKVIVPGLELTPPVVLLFRSGE
ncbi:hypothetical protein A2U01_0094582, partial [Trifolium medium]|nr:hypothetical protein [Trifolium medium]